MMNLKEIKDMINLMNENNLVELEMERDGLKIRLKKSQGSIQQEIIHTPIISGAGIAHPMATQAELKEQPKQPVTTVEITAPMVGTFYRALAPEVPPFVTIGQEIDIGQVVCIIEAMKLMNEIKSEVKGKILHIRVENGDPVEFGQTLFVIEPT